MKKCLIVTKNKSLPGDERSMVEKLAKICEVEVVSTSQMIAHQKTYSDPALYHALVVFGGDGSILKAVSICTPKKEIGDSPSYIDKLGDEHVRMYVKSEENTQAENAGTLLPPVFAFDYSTRGRLCNIRKPAFKEAEEGLLSYVKKKASFEDTEDVRSWSIRRSRFVVNQSVASLNEIYIFCSEKGFIDVFEVYIDEHCVFNSIRCDGVIICTSSGSSGYNSSANGPVVHSDLECVVLTTVCSPDKKVPSIVIDSSRKITVKSKNRYKKLAAVIDGCLRVEEYSFVVERMEKGDVYFADFGEDRAHRDFLASLQETP